MAERTKERITPRQAGWCWLQVDEEPGLVVVVRFDGTPTGRLSIAEMTVARYPGVTADALRAIRVGRVEAWANGPGREAMLAALEDRARLSADQQARIDTNERRRPSFTTSPEAIAAAEQHMALAAQAGADSDQFARGEIGIGVGVDGVPVVLRPKVLRRSVRNLRLKVPEGQPKPDSFYREVARLYSDLALDSDRPAAELADANGEDVTVKRIHGWIKEARRRGLLAPGERQARKP